jgi:putative ABC transport system permease protein
MTNYLRALAVRLRGLFGDRRAERELGEEIEAHLRLLTERYVRQGMSEAEAAWAARRQFGNIALLQEASREMRGIRSIETLFQDLRYGARMLRRNPGFTFVAALTLSLGIGANTAIFSVVDAVVFRPLPYDEPERLAQVWPVNLIHGSEGGVPYPNFADWRDRNHVFEQLAAYGEKSFIVTGGEEAQRIIGAGVSPSLFPLLRAKPEFGRALLPEDDRVEASPVVLISHRLWRERFGADPQAIGKTLTLDGKIFAVIGVMPSWFHFPEETELWIPVAHVYTRILANRNAGSLSVIGRLKTGVGREYAQAEMEAISRQLEQEYPNANAGWSVRLIPQREMMVGNIKYTLLILLGAVGLVALIACANVANLSLARGAARRKEAAIRVAIGASRFRLIRQHLTESILLALLGGGLGVLLALWSVNLLVTSLPNTMPRANEIGIDWRALGFNCLVSILTGILFGLAPALQGSKPELNEALKEGGGKATGDPGRSRLRGLLVVAEVALSLMLLAGAGLLIKSLWYLQQVNPGFNYENTLALSLSLPNYKYPEKRQQVAFYQRALSRLETLPGVTSVGASTMLPLSGSRSRQGFSIEGRAPSSPGEVLQADDRSISPGYFRATGIPLLRGRAFTEADDTDGPPVVIINETMARRFWPGEDALGKRITWGRATREIVGIVGDVRHRRLDADLTPEMYGPYLQNPRPDLSFVVRAGDGEANLAAAARNELRNIDRDQPITEITTLAQLRSRSAAQPRFNTLLLGLFAAIALTLAAIGVYGVISYSVTQRTHEIGVRMALGAQASDVLRMVVWRGMSLALIGAAIGLAAALALTRVMKNLLFNVNATDPATFALVALLLVGVALIAIYIPARRATKVDPLLAFRHE